MKKVLILLSGLIIVLVCYFISNQTNLEIVKPIPKEEPPMLSPKKVKNIVVYDFWAPWCPPCRQLAPTFDAWKNKHSKDNIVFKKVNIDEDSALATKYSISSIPTILVTVDGIEVKRWAGAPRESDVLEYLK